MIAFSTLFLILVILLILYFINASRRRHPNFPPGLPRLPIYGSYWILLWKNWRYFHKALEYFGKKYNVPILGFYMGDIPAVATFSYELCKAVLTRDEFTSRSESIVLKVRGEGDLPGVIFGSNWKEQRWLALRNMRDFGFGRRSFKVEDYTEGEIRNLIELFTSEPTAENEDVCRKRGIVKVPDVYQGHLMNLICLILTATRYDYFKLRQLVRTQMKFIRSADPSGNAITLTPWLKYIAPGYFGIHSAVYDNKPMLDFLKAEIEEHKRSFISGYARDFIDIYLEELEKVKADGITDTSVSEKELLYSVLDFMFPAPIAAGETINYIFAYLIYNPDVQKKIQEEIDRVVGRARLPTLDDRKDMPYVEATIRESIRINSITPLSVPRRANADTELAGYFIPKGTFVYPCVSSVHFDAKLFKDPERFLPERWLDANGQLLKKDYTLGFGAGKRLCAGETFARHTMFLLISGLMQHFTFKTPENYPKPDMDNLVPGIVLSIPSYWMEVVARD